MGLHSRKEAGIMPGMMAYCGLACETCPIYLATRQENDQERLRMRSEIVRLCKEHYGIQYGLSEITDCDGCRSESGRIFSASAACPIRNCARNRKVETCAYCAAYPCEQLEKFFTRESAARSRLEAMHHGR